MKKIFLLLMGVMLLTGCEMKSEQVITINNDKSMEISGDAAMDYELIDAMLSTGDSFDEETYETETKEYTQEERLQKFKEMITDKSINENDIYDDGNFIGYKFTSKIDNIDNLIGDTQNITTNDLSKITTQKMFTKEGNTYKGKIIISKGDEDEEQNRQENNASSGIKITNNFTVNLSSKALSNNATTVSEDGKTLTWDLTKDIQTIEFEFNLGTNYNMFIIAGIAIVVVLIIVLLITALIKKSKSKKTNYPQPEPTNNEQIQQLNINSTPQITEIQPQNIMPQQQVTNVEPTEPVIEQQPTINIQPVTEPTLETQIPEVQPQNIIQQPEQVTNIEPALNVEPTEPVIEQQPMINIQPITEPTTETQIPEVQPQNIIQQPEQVTSVEPVLNVEPTQQINNNNENLSNNIN